MESEENLFDLKTVKRFCEENPSFSEGGLRHQIFNAEKFNLTDCFVRLGKKVFIHEKRYYRRIMEQNQRGTHA
jgi:hypothetical protein